MTAIITRRNIRDILYDGYPDAQENDIFEISYLKEEGIVHILVRPAKEDRENTYEFLIYYGDIFKKLSSPK